MLNKNSILLSWGDGLDPHIRTEIRAGIKPNSAMKKWITETKFCILQKKCQKFKEEKVFEKLSNILILKNLFNLTNCGTTIW